MSDFFEVDVLDVETKKSGDAIPIRYSIGGVKTIHVVDGGFQETGDKLVKHIQTHYENPTFIDRVILTHNDGDHAGGLSEVFEKFQVGELWMLRPWLYAEELLPRFARFTTVDGLSKRLKEAYPNIADLEELAEKKGVPIYEPFQGAAIGAFTVLSPSKATYLDLVVGSTKTPQEAAQAKDDRSLAAFILEKAAAVVRYVLAKWGVETLSDEATTIENEMSVIQFAELQGRRVLLTGDTGRRGLEEAADYATAMGVTLPGIDHFQVPHHGSRRNVSTELLDRWLGDRLPEKPAKGEETFTAIISAAKEDEHHPRKAVVRAMIHRGAKVITTQGGDIATGMNMPAREGWNTVPGLPYPEEQEG